MSDDFNGYSNGSLSGQGSWVGLNASSLAFQVDDAAAVPYGCYSDGGRYVGPAAAFGVPHRSPATWHSAQ